MFLKYEDPILELGREKPPRPYMITSGASVLTLTQTHSPTKTPMINKSIKLGLTITMERIGYSDIL